MKKLIFWSAVSLLAVSVHAQTFITTGGAWNTAGNWTPSGVPNATGASATFVSPTATQTVTLGAAITVGSLSITNNTTNALTISNGTGGSLTFDATSGNAAVTVDGTGNVVTTISATTVLTDTLVATINNTATTSASGALTMTGGISGAGGITKSGAGTLSFTTAAKTYTGATAITAGILRLTATGAPTGTSSVSISSGAQLRLDTSGTTTSYTLGSGTITLNGLGTSASLGAIRQNTTGATDSATLNNALNFASEASIAANGTTFASGSTLTLSGALSGSGNLVKQGLGKVVLSGTNTAFTGGTRVENGTLTVNTGSALGTGGVTFFQLLGNSAALTLNNAAQTIADLATSWNDTTGTLAQTLTLNNTALTIVQAGTTTFGNGAVSTLTGTIAGTGSVALAAASTGTLTLSGANTYTGGTTVGGGTLTAAHSSALGTGPLTLNGGSLLSSIPSLSAGGNVLLAGGLLALNGTSAGVLSLASGKNFTMSGGTLNLTLGTSFDQIVSAGGGSSFNLSGGTLAFDTSGAGFSYASSYQLLSGFGSGSVSGLTLSGYNTAAYTASLSPLGVLTFSASAIPEPSTYAALAGGVALLGAGLLRRRRRA